MCHGRNKPGSYVFIYAVLMILVFIAVFLIEILVQRVPKLYLCVKLASRKLDYLEYFG